MNLDLHQIGLFQFENLIQNRIPFVLIHFGQDLNLLFAKHHLILAQAKMLDATSFFPAQNWFKKNLLRQYFPQENIEKFFAHLTTEHIGPDSAVVVFGDANRPSEVLVQEFIQRQYLNSFFIAGGMSALLQEKSLQQNQ
jgi:hypothetical protein